jgi:gliding motility-associated-like protein
MHHLVSRTSGALVRLAVLGVLLAHGATGTCQIGFGYVGIPPCLGTNVSVNAQLVIVNPPATPYTFQWTVTSPTGTVITSSVNDTLGVSFNVVGCWHVELVVNGIFVQDDSCGVEVFQSPTAVIDPISLTGCVPFAPVLDDISIPGSGTNLSQTWDVALCSLLFVPNINGQCVITLPGTYDVSLSVTDENGCFGSQHLNGVIEVSNDPPNSSFTASSLYDCNAPLPIDFISTSTGANGPLTYEWTLDSVLIGTSDSLTYVFAGPGSYTVCLLVTDALGCTDNSCRTVNIFDTPAPSFSINPAVICAGMSVALQNTSTPTPIPTVQWDLNGDGTIDATGNSPSFSYPAPGSYDIELFIRYSDHCQDSLTQTVTVAPQIDALFAIDTTWACSLPFTIGITDQSTGTGTLTYDWFYTQPPSNVRVPITLTGSTYTFNTWGQYRIGLTLTNGIGCFDEYIFPTTINVRQPQLAFNLTAPSSCVGDLINTNIYLNQSLQPFVNWYYDVGCDGPGPLDQQILGNTNGNTSFNFLAAGTYTVCLVAESAGGCSSSYQSSITVAPPITSTFSVSDTTPCAIDDVVFTADNPDPALTYTWNYGDGIGTGIGSSTTYNYSDTGTFTITLNVSNMGCFTTTTIDSLIMVPVPIADFQINTNCTDYYTVTFTNNSILPDTADIVWTIDGVDMYVGVWEPTHTFITEGTHTVTLTVDNDSTGCSDATTRTVKINEPEFEVDINPVTGCPPVAVNITPLNTECVVLWEVFTEGTNFLRAQYGPPGQPWYMNWSVPGSSSSAVDTMISWPAVEYNALGSFDISMRITDVNGCQIDTTYANIINVDIDPFFARFDTVVTRFCDSTVVCATPLLSNLMNWQWSTNTGLSDTVETPCFTFYPPYNQGQGCVITLTAELPGGCSSTVSDALFLPRNTNACITATDHNPCKMEEVTLDAGCTVCDLAPCTYSWDLDSDGVFGDTLGTTATVSWPSNGVYTMHLLVTDSTGCTDQDSITETVHTPETQLLMEDTIIACITYIDIQNITSGPGISSDWVISGFDDQGPVGPYSEFDPAGYAQVIGFGEQTVGIYDIFVQSTNQYGCVDTLLIDDFLGYGSVLGDFTSTLDTLDCAPFSITCNAFNTSDTSFVYTWNMGDNTAYTTTSVSHQYDSPGTYQVSLTIADPVNNCAFFLQGDTFSVSLLSFDFVGDTIVCPGDSALITVTGLDSLVWEPSPNAISSAGPDQWYLTPNGSSTYTATGYLAGCEAQQTLTLYTYEPPVFSVDPFGPFCANEGVLPLPVVSPAGGNFQLGPTPVTALSSIDLNVGSNTLSYQLLDTNGCWQSTDVVFLVKDTTLITFTNGQLCEDDMLALQPSASHLPASFSVDYGTGMQAATVFDPQLLNMYPGTATDYAVEYQYTNAVGCTSLVVGNITVHPLPQTVFQLSDLCISDSLSVNNSSYVVNDTIATSNWTFGSFGTSTDTEPTGITFPTDGTFAITLTTVSDEACSSSMTDSVTVHPLPVLSSTAYPALCENDGVVALPNASPAPGSFTWNGSTVSSLNTALLENLNTIVYHHTDLNGCTDSIPITVVVNDSTLINLQLMDLCIDALPVDLVAASSHGAGLFTASYDGSTNDTLTTFDPSAIVSYPLISTDFIVQYQYQNAAGCWNLTSDTLGVHPLPVVGMAVGEACEGLLVSIQNTTTIGSGNINSQLWEIIGYGVDTSWVPSAVSYANYGDFPITLTATSDQGCTATTSDTIHIHPYPQLDLVSGPVCFLEDVTVQNNSTIAQGAINGVQYAWGDNTTSSDTSMLVAHNYTNWGAYSIAVQAGSDAGCVSYDTLHVQVHPLPEPHMILTDHCLGTQTTISDSSTIAQGSIATVAWSVPAEGIQLNGSQFDLTFSQFGTFMVYQTLTSLAGCTAQDSATVVVYDVPVPGFVLDDTPLCVFNEIELQDASTINAPYSIADVQWVIGSDSLYGPTSSWTFYEAGPVDLHMTVWSNVGCVSSITLQDAFEIAPLPTSAFAIVPNEITIVLNQASFIDHSTGAAQWEYFVDDGTWYSTRSPHHIFEELGEYTVLQIVTSEFGCVDSSYQRVTVKPDLVVHVPNAVTFNDDLINDEFYPVLFGDEVALYEFDIFDRWGERIFSSNDREQKWDGTVNGSGQPVPIGVYIWQLHVKGTNSFTKLLRGSVTVLR